MFNNSDAPKYAPPLIRTGGYCSRCRTEHSLGTGNTMLHCFRLMEQFKIRGTIDLFSAPGRNDTSLDIAYLFGPARGKMFGVLECLAPDGTITILNGFSGQYNGRWLINGWVPPLFDVADFHTLTRRRERQIKELGRQIETSPRMSEQRRELKKERRRLSQELMRDIHGLYRVNNFRGESVSLKKAFLGTNGIPAGTGDCCAPKLLQYAAKNSLQPLGISEFYWGLKNRSGTHCHGSFTSACKEKCRPLLGFMLCGLKQKSDMPSTRPDMEQE